MNGFNTNHLRLVCHVRPGVTEIVGRSDGPEAFQRLKASLGAMWGKPAAIRVDPAGAVEVKVMCTILLRSMRIIHWPLIGFIPSK